MKSLLRRNLQLYLRHREQRMTITGLLWANRRMYALLATAFGLFAAFLYYAVGAFAAWYIGVAFATLLARDIGFYRRSVMLWPVLEQVFDWDRIEQLAASAEPKTAGQ